MEVYNGTTMVNLFQGKRKAENNAVCRNGNENLVATSFTIYK